MKIYYHCELCGAAIGMLDMEYVDEVKLGFDCLTSEERQDIIEVDHFANTMHVKSLCDDCVKRLGLDREKIRLH
ncbi:anti-sigma-F factor Fin [Anaerosinus massiliensis]|uniref:anti-sigma-F factor Fin n=1 Tax=Massilibacillus massiliensis TaxID=1806837 RepID=UPI000DA6332A|nr:anti-sigma-F factor Fin [Massilibacillus massiliensis]